MALSEKEISALKRAAEQRRDEQVRDAERQLQVDLEAIKHVVELQRKAGSAPAAPANSLPDAGSNHKWPGLRGAVREALKHVPRKFTIEQVATWLQALYPEHELNRTYLSGELYNLKEHKEILVHKAGAGRRATIYKKEAISEG